MENMELIYVLEELAERLINGVTAGDLGIREGTVMTIGPAPYRRLDCDGRALAYVRVRPRKRAVRVDISGLWVARTESRIRHKSASGSATLLIRAPDEVEEAIRYLHDAVAVTRQAEHVRWPRQPSAA